MTRHPLVAPVSPATTVSAHLCVYPINAAQLVAVLDVKPKALRRVLAGKKPGAKFARRWMRATGQDLMAMWWEVKAWEREDERLAKEKR